MYRHLNQALRFTCQQPDYTGISVSDTNIKGQLMAQSPPSAAQFHVAFHLTGRLEENCVYYGSVRIIDADIISIAAGFSAISETN